MDGLPEKLRIVLFGSMAILPALSIAGCGPNYRELRLEGQKSFADGAYGTARILYAQADEEDPRRVENLHDLGACSVLLAREDFEQGNRAAAMREVDAAVAYYRQGIDVHPGHQACLQGLNIALELKGQFREALATAEWSVRFVGPSARQYLFLAAELRERGDSDGAFLRYGQAVTVEPRSAEAHRAFAEFLLEHGNESATVHHLQQAYLLNPRDPWVMDELIARKALPPLAPKD